MKQLSDKFVYWFTIIGSITSIIFVIIVIMMDLYLKEFTFSIANIIELHKINKILWIIDATPFILISFSYFVGKELGVYAQKLSNAKNRTEKKSKKIFDFIEQIRQGDIEAEYNAEDGDILGETLINLRNELLQKEKEDSIRKKEDDQRHWATEGLAKFGVILRENNDNLEELSYNIISELVKYIDAKQAGLFLLNDSDSQNKYFDQTASFAYGRKKFVNKKIAWGEGLVGACVLEQKTIFLKQVSEKYVKITSGLGNANPRSLLIVPLKVNDDIYGALEVASFKKYDPFEVEFVEKVAEGIGSTISSLKTNLQTAMLLKESQNQAEIMARQENEMRSNMEELKQTQIEAAKQAEQFVSFTTSVNHTLIRAEYNIDGKLLYANTKFLEKLGYKSFSEIEDQYISIFINDKDKEWFNRLWQGLADGGPHFEGDMKHVAKNGTDLWTMATYVSVRNAKGKPEKILFLGIDTTESKQQSLDNKGQIDALERSSLKAEYLPSGQIIEYNKNLMASLGYSKTDLLDKNIFDFINSSELVEFNIIWQNVLKGKPFEGRSKQLTKAGDIKWFHGTYTTSYDMYGDVVKVIYVANDITEQILSEIKNKEQHEVLIDQEKKLQQAKTDLSKKLTETKEEMKLQFREIEIVKILHEKTLQGMQDAVISIDQKNNITFFNKQAEQLWNITQTEILHNHISTLLPDKSKDLEGEYMGGLFGADKLFTLNTRLEVYIVDSNGEQIDVLLTLSEAQVGNNYSLTAFVQKIEVELF